MRTLITGGAGFLGSHISDRLAERGDQMLVIDNLATGRVGNLPVSNRLEFVEGTIADRDLVDRCFDHFRPEVVIHAAAAYKDPNDWKEDIQTNALGTAHIAKAAKRCGAGRIIYLQTSLCYGKPDVSPIPVNHPIRPFTSYAISKVAGERYVALSGVPYVSLRLANIYGPRHSSGPIPVFYKRLKEEKVCRVSQTRRDFTYVDDFLRLVQSILDQPEVCGCFNVCTGRDVSIKEVLDAMADRMEIRRMAPVSPVPAAPDDVETLLLDPTLTEETFGWKATTSLGIGLDALIHWFDEHGVEEAYTHLQGDDSDAETASDG